MRDRVELYEEQRDACGNFMRRVSTGEYGWVRYFEACSRVAVEREDGTVCVKSIDNIRYIHDEGAGKG